MPRFANQSMREATMIRLDAPRLGRRPLICPVCGRVHGIGRWLFALAMLAAAVFALPVGGLARVDTQAARRAEPGHAKPEPAAELMPAIVSASAAPPAGLPSKPAPTAIAIPDTAVVWNRTGLGVYLWDRPGGGIAGFVENGLMVRVMENWETYGGVPFGEVMVEEEIGWVDMRSVHRVVLAEGGFKRLPQGAYLYAEPGGRALVWLTPGTPVVVIGLAGLRWMEVELVIGGETGWIVAAWSEMP
jgi:hypothetical protein